jgi:hypothetical protein
MTNSRQSRNNEHLTQSAMAAACHAQLLIGSLGIADAELEVSLHDGAASPLGLVVHRWLSAAHDRQTARARQEQQEETICRFWPHAAGRILSAAELREEVAAGMSEFLRSCRLSLGDYQFGFDFASGQLTARKGLLRDLVVGRRFFMEEIPGMGGFAAAMRRTGGLLGRTF